MKKILTPIIMAMCLFIGIIASAGAFNYASLSAEHLYSFAGVVNLIIVCLFVHRKWKEWKTME